MENNQEQTEGQSVARAILAGEKNAWVDFQRMYGEAMARIASKRAKSEKLRSEFTSEDIINGFMAEKLLDQPERMFGPVAKGQRPLTTRLLRSLGNYCNSLHRRRRRTVHSEKSLETHQDEKSNDDPDYYPHETAVLIKKRIDEQQRMIRETFSTLFRIRGPQREVLLLSERVRLAEQIAVGYCKEHQSFNEQDAARRLVTTLYPWIDDESATPIPMVNDPLSTIWDAISRNLFNPPFGADSSTIAERIQVLPNTWDTWVRRARLRVIASHEEALAHLCDHVLTRPEALYWSILIGDYREIVDPNDENELEQISVAIWSGDKQSDVQRLYDGYAQEISLSLCIAASQHWQWEETRFGKTKHFGIGANGVTVIWCKQVVVSAMLEQYAAPPPRQNISHYDRKENSRPRRATWGFRYGKFRSLHPKDNEETRYELFTKRFLSVRRRFQAASKGGKTIGNPLNPTETPIPTLEEWRRISEDALTQHAQSEQRK